MILSTKVNLKYANKDKLRSIDLFIEEYKRVVSIFIDTLWNLPTIPKLLPHTITSQITTWIIARAIQAAAKQASGIVRGARRKQKKRLYIYNKLIETGKYKQARKLKRVIELALVSKPIINNIQPELDSRFVKVEFDNDTTTFDGWMTLTNLGNKLKIILPFKKTKHFNRILAMGKLKQGIRLSNNTATFNFDIEIPKKTIGQTIGIDIGVKNVFSASNGIASTPDIHKHTLDTINTKLSRKKKGSKAFLKAQHHRTNYINWSLNQLDLTNIQIIKIEDIKNMRKGKTYSRKLSHFVYTEVFNKINRLAELTGCSIVKVNPTYTSQRCSSCGWVCKKNRKGKQFKCVICKFEKDADLNASFNILLDLPNITKEERLLQKNRKGFYWNVKGKTHIVSSTHKSNLDECP